MVAMDNAKIEQKFGELLTPKIESFAE